MRLQPFINLPKFTIKKQTLYALLFQGIISSKLSANSPTEWQEAIQKPNIPEMQLLPGGLTNKTYKYNKNDKSFVIRIGTQETDRLNINREREILFHKLGYSLGLSPKIYYSNFKKGLLVTEFITGKPLKSDDLKDIKTLLKIVTLIKKLHSHKIQKSQKIGSYYLSAIDHLLKHLAFKTGYEIQNIRYAILVAKKFYNKMPEERFQVASHNDFFARNLMNENGKLWLIDWEYADWGSQYNDLASLSMEDELSEKQEKILLESYFGKISPEQYKNFKGVCAFYSLQSSVWSFSQLQNKQNTENRPPYETAVNHHLNKFWKNISFLKTKEFNNEF